ncbi:hypothetical protein HDU85_007545 [Gaertneriomyces sp. JEL0708]|nr:hypothetical protein HDU85_007545 [Gaertneriomyces sp. JEL0708]
MSHVPAWKLPTPPSASTSSKIKVATVGLQDLSRFGVESAAIDNFATPKDVRRHKPPGGSTISPPAESSESAGSPTPESNNRSHTDSEAPARFLWSSLKRSAIVADGVTKEAVGDAEGNKRKRASPPAWENHIGHADISAAQHDHKASSRSEVAGGCSTSQIHAVCADGPMNGYDSESEDESILANRQQLLRGDDGVTMAFSDDGYF